MNNCKLLKSATLLVLFTCYSSAFTKVIAQEIPSTVSENDMVPAPSDRPNRPVNRFALSVRSAFETANQSNPERVATLKNLDIALAQIKSAGAFPNPQFALQYGFGTPYTETVAGNTQTIGANQLIEMGGKRGARLKLARANLSLIQAQLDALRIDIRSKVRKQYAELAAAEANIELVENQRKLVEQLYVIALKKVKNNKAPESEALHARLSVEQFETLRNLALSRLRQASVKLDYLVGYEPERDIDVEDNTLFTLSSERTELVPQPDYIIPPLQALLQWVLHNPIGNLATWLGSF